MLELNGKVYVQKHDESLACRLCAFNHDSPGCVAAGTDCLYKDSVWVERVECVGAEASTIIVDEVKE